MNTNFQLQSQSVIFLRYYFILLLILLIGFEGKTQLTRNILAGDSVTVIATSGLNHRLEPDDKSGIITAIPFGARIKILEVSDKFYRSGELSGYWMLVEYQNVKGYVYSPYLTLFKIPKVITNTEDCIDIDWLEKLFRLNIDSLVYKGERYYEGYDGDGKDHFNSSFEYYKDETIIYYINGYEYTDLIIETRELNLDEFKQILQFWISKINVNCKGLKNSYGNYYAYKIDVKNDSSGVYIEKLYCEELNLEAEISMNKTIIKINLFDL